MQKNSVRSEGSELIGTWEKPTGIGIDREPESAPSYLYLYWGSTTNRRFTGDAPAVVWKGRCYAYHSLFNQHLLLHITALRFWGARAPHLPHWKHTGEPSLGVR